MHLLELLLQNCCFFVHLRYGMLAWARPFCWDGDADVSAVHFLLPNLPTFWNL